MAQSSIPLRIDQIELFTSSGPGATPSPDTHKLIVDVRVSLKDIYGESSNFGMISDDLFENFGVALYLTTNIAYAQDIFQNPSKFGHYWNSDTAPENNGRLFMGLQSAEILPTGDDAPTSATDLRSAGHGEIYGNDLPFLARYFIYGGSSDIPMTAGMMGFNPHIVLPTQGPNPSYLAVFGAPVHELHPTSQWSPGPSREFGVVVNDLIIKNGKVNHSGIILRMKGGPVSGQIYTGPAHIDSSGIWRIGASAGQSGALMIGTNKYSYGQALQVENVYNSKIIDNRKIQRLDRLEPNFGSIKGAWGDVIGRLDRMTKEQIRPFDEMLGMSRNPGQFFSAINYSVSTDNRLKLHFDFNYGHAILINAQYAELFSAEADPQQILNCCGIKSVKILRRRINSEDNVNKLTGGDSPLRIYDSHEKVVGQATPLRINRSSEGGGQEGILSYMALDVEMDNITAGLYEYGVEIDIIDKSRDKIRAILADPSQGLDRLISQLETWLTLSLAPGNYNVAFNRYSTNFLQSAGNGWDDPEATPMKAIGAYFAARNMLFNTALSPDALNASESDKTEIMAALNPSVAGPAGPQHLIKILKNFASAVRSSLGLAAATTESETQQPSGVPSARMGGMPRIFTIKHFFKKAFNADDLLDMGLDYLSLDDPGGGASGAFLGYIKRGSWAQLALNEEGKREAAEELSVAITTGLARTLETLDLEIGDEYLTPNYLKPLGARRPLRVNNPTSINTPLHGPPSPARRQRQAVNLAVYQLLYQNMTKNSPPIPPEGEEPLEGAEGSNIGRRQQAQYKIQEEVMSVNGADVSLLNRSTWDPIANVFPESVEGLHTLDGLRGAGEIDAASIFGVDDPFILEHMEEQSSLSGSSSEEFLNPDVLGSGADRVDSLLAQQNLLSDYLMQADFFGGRLGGNTPVSSFSDNSFLRNGNMTLDMASATLGNTSGKVALIELHFMARAIAGALRPVEIALNAIRYGFVYKVECLRGYSGESISSTGGFGGLSRGGMNNPIWGPLKTSYLNELGTSGIAGQGITYPYLCRLVKHQTILKEFKGLKVPIYNETFLIGPDNVNYPAVLPYPQPTPLPPPAPLPVAPVLPSPAEASSVQSGDPEVLGASEASPETNGNRPPLNSEERYIVENFAVTTGPGWRLGSSEIYEGPYYLLYDLEHAMCRAHAGSWRWEEFKLTRTFGERLYPVSSAAQHRMKRFQKMIRNTGATIKINGNGSSAQNGSAGGSGAEGY